MGRLTGKAGYATSKSSKRNGGYSWSAGLTWEDLRGDLGRASPIALNSKESPSELINSEGKVGRGSQLSPDHQS